MIRRGKIVECQNLHPAPENNFQFDPEDLSKATATWHTHVNGTANLSLEDYRFYLAWPKLNHFIVTSDKVNLYVVESGVVYQANAENDLPSRLLE